MGLFVTSDRDPPTPTGEDQVAAAIDIGSNSIKMTIARPAPDGGLDEFAWRSETVRLGAGLDATGRLADDRIEAAMAALGEFAEVARGFGAVRLVAVATEATRVAGNGPAFLQRVARETSIDVRAIGGDEEAALTFQGLAASVDLGGEMVVADIGGASTEVILAQDGAVRAARSIPLGSGRLTDRLVASDPPSTAELVACQDAAAAAIGGLDTVLELPAAGQSRLVVVGGTGEFLARLVPEGDSFRPSAIETMLDLLRRAPAAEVADRLGIPEARARVLPAGAAIVAALADRVRPVEIEVARSGIRAGLLLALFAEWERSGPSTVLSDSTTVKGVDR